MEALTFVCSASVTWSFDGMLISIVCGLLSEVQSMKKVISNMFMSTIGVKSTRTVIFFCLPFFPSFFSLSVFTSAMTLVVVRHCQASF